MTDRAEKGYEKRGVPEQRAQQIAWATVNKTYGGGLRTTKARRIIRQPQDHAVN